MNGLELLLMIEKRPALYIGEGDLMSLKHFIDGFCVCAQLHQIEYGENELQAFNRYVLQFYRDQRAISLYHCILERTTTKEEAFACFFELLHKFIHFQTV